MLLICGIIAALIAGFLIWYSEKGLDPVGKAMKYMDVMHLVEKLFDMKSKDPGTISSMVLESLSTEESKAIEDKSVVTKAQDATKRKKQAFLKKMQRFENRLANFIDTGVWKKTTNKEVKITDNDEQLQTLLLTITKENQIIQARYPNFFKDKSQEQKITVLLALAQDKIRSELKKRQDRLRQRKMSFLLED
jgi:hypothetical protein